MSFDDYANYIYQKHRLAVALAIIKSKPANVNTEQYLDELKSKIDHKMDDDVTVCSDDFLMKDDEDMNDSVTILKDFNPEFVNNDEKLLGDDKVARQKPSTVLEITNRNIPENLSQITYYDGSQNQTTFHIDEPYNEISQSQNDYNLNQKLDIEEFISKNVVRKEFNDKINNVSQNTDNGKKSINNITEPVLDIILPQSKQKVYIEKSLPKYPATKEVNEKIRNVEQNTDIGQKFTKKTYSQGNNKNTMDSHNETIATISNESMDVTYYDSQKTLLYTVHGFTQNYTHYSPSQTDMYVIPNKYLYNVNKNNANNFQNKDKETHIVAANMNDFENETQFTPVSTGKGLNSITDKNLTNKDEFEYIQTMNMFSQCNDDNFDEIQNNVPIINSETHETMNDVNIIINKEIEDKNNRNSPRYSQNNDEYFGDIQILENNTRNSFIIENNLKESGYNPKIANMELTEEPFGYAQKIDYLSQDRNSFFIENNSNFNKNGKANKTFNEESSVNRKKLNCLSQDIEMHNNKIEAEKAKINDTNQFTNESNTVIPTQNSENNYELATIPSGNDSSDKYRREEEEFESEEIISYKVLEEFNKVKSFLNRQNRRMSCEGFSTDSGYRSESQRSSSRSAFQLSGNWLNQSGCCLFNYIMQCPLVAGTRDITNEIAEVLSQLIDRLHEEEKYPSFLEDLLETVDLLLRQVYEGGTSEDGEFLKKDENLQRILLLNKSIHIQKHSLEKITDILEEFHSQVTKIDSTYELSNIDQIENIAYIFHILEILLKNYLKNREIYSQTSTQNSQDDEKVFKKSSITEIWRKKWNPSQKVFEGSREKKCVLKNCSEILNKIVVDCVGSYSLVAYSALKCFNCMQT